MAKRVKFHELNRTFYWSPATRQLTTQSGLLVRSGVMSEKQAHKLAVAYLEMIARRRAKWL